MINEKYYNYDYCDYLADDYKSKEDKFKKNKEKIEERLGITLPIDYSPLLYENEIYDEFLEYLKNNIDHLSVQTYIKKYALLKHDYSTNFEMFIKYLNGREDKINKAFELIIAKIKRDTQNTIINPIKESLETILQNVRFNLDVCQSECEKMFYQIVLGRINANEIKCQYKISKMTVDFAIPYKKLVFEVDGKRYHENGSGDCYRDVRLREFGWRVIRYPCSVIKRAYCENQEYLLNDLKQIISKNN